MQRIHFLTAHDHAAIDHTGDDGRQFPRGDRHHGFIKQPEALLDPPLLDQRVPLLVHGEREQVLITEALADLGSIGCRSVSGLPVTAGLMPQHDRHQQIAPLDAVASLAFDQPLGTAEPACRPAHLASECKVHAHPERAAHSAHRFTTVQVHVIGTLQAAQALVVAAEHEGRCCELFEVLRSERRRPTGA
jgi:hypothetical protein